MKRSKKYILYTVFVPFVILFIILINKIAEEQTNKYDMLLLFTETKTVNDVVKKAKNNRRKVSIYTFNSGELVFENPVNYKYNPAALYKFVIKGDSIIKKSNSDTIIVVRNSVRFYFINGNSFLNYGVK